MNQCEKCHRQLLTCQSCKGKPYGGGIIGTTCGKCKNTGVVCPIHEGHWQR